MACALPPAFEPSHTTPLWTNRLKSPLSMRNQSQKRFSSPAPAVKLAWNWFLTYETCLASGNVIASDIKIPGKREVRSCCAPWHCGFFRSNFMLPLAVDFRALLLIWMSWINPCWPVCCWNMTLTSLSIWPPYSQLLENKTHNWH